MAGTAEGIAKARAAQAAKRAAREQAEPVQQSQQNRAIAVLDNDLSTVEPCSPVAEPSPASRAANQELARSEVSTGAAEGAQFLRRLLRNAKAGARLRYEAACSLLEFAGFGKGGPAPSDDSDLGQLSRLVELRQRAAGAETVVVEAEPSETAHTSK